MKTKRPDTSKIKYLDFEFVGAPLITKDAQGGVVIEGYANTVDRDRVQEVVLPSAFESSLPGFMENPVMLFQHDWDKVIGSFSSAKIDDKGLFVKGRVSAAKDCDDTRTKILEGSLRTFSIGYNEITSVYDEAKKVKIIKDLELLEISVVTIPANPQAKFTPVQEQPVAEGGAAKVDAVPAKSLPPLEDADMKIIKGLDAIIGCPNKLAQVLAYLSNEKGTEPMTPNPATPVVTTPAVKTEAAAPAQTPAVPAAAADGAPAAAPAGGADLAKVMETLTAMMAALKQISEAIAPAKATEPTAAAATDGAAAAADAGKPKDEEEEKDPSKMTEEELAKELAKVEGQLETLTAE